MPHPWGIRAGCRLYLAKTCECREAQMARFHKEVGMEYIALAILITSVKKTKNYKTIMHQQ